MLPDSPPKETAAEAAVREGLTFRAGLHRLLGLFGAESIGRNLESEDKAFGRACNGDELSTPDEAGEMKITSAGNVTINYAQPEAAPSGSQQPSVAHKPKAGGGWLPKLLLLASLAGGGAGVGYIVNDLLKPSSVDTDTDTITELDFPQ